MENSSNFFYKHRQSPDGRLFPPFGGLWSWLRRRGRFSPGWWPVRHSRSFRSRLHFFVLDFCFDVWSFALPTQKCHRDKKCKWWLGSSRAVRALRVVPGVPCAGTVVRWVLTETSFGSLVFLSGLQVLMNSTVPNKVFRTKVR